jgi:hypothetical protein
MLGRRSVAWLCVLLAHALAILLLLAFDREISAGRHVEELSSELISLYPPTEEEVREPVRAAPSRSAPARHRRETGESSAISSELPPPQPHPDWSMEAQKSAARILERQAAAERQAKLFSGPQGTWPSLTKRAPSGERKFPWKPGIDGPEYDEHGNRVFHPTDNCVARSTMTSPALAITCALDKPKARGDLFDDMKKHFDEQRLPETKDGNGTEPEAQRPAN